MSAAPPARRPFLLVDARPAFHPTAAGRGIGNYVRGLISGLQAVDAPFQALVTRSEDARQLAADLDDGRVAIWSRAAVRASPSDTWFVATGMFLHPISFDALPLVVTEAAMPVASIMYDVIPFRRAATHLTHTDARRMARLRAELTRTVDAVLAISEFAASTSVQELGLDATRVNVVGAGVADRFVPRRAQDGTVEVVSPDRPPRDVVAVVGSDPHKNVERLIEAWVAVTKSVTDARLVLVGGGTPSRAAWQVAAAGAGVDGSVVVAGGVDDATLVQMLQDAALSVTPSLEEGFGLPVLEAAACGCPAICSNTSALPEILDEPAACFDPTSADAIAEAIVRALDDCALRERLRAAGVRAVERWTWPNVARAVEDAVAATTPRWPGPRRVRRRVAFVGAGAELEAAATALVDASPAAEVWLGVPRWDRSAAASIRRFDPAGFGRLVRPHEFDDIVTLVDAPADIGARVAARHPTHVWVGGVEPRAIDWSIARSAIVPDEEVASIVADLGRGVGRSDLPVLVLGRRRRAAEAARALDRFLAGLERRSDAFSAPGYAPRPS